MISEVLDKLEAVAERRKLSIFQSTTDNSDHPLRSVVVKQRSTFMHSPAALLNTTENPSYPPPSDYKSFPCHTPTQ